MFCKRYIFYIYLTFAILYPTSASISAYAYNQQIVTDIQMLGAIANKNGTGVALVKNKNTGNIQAIRINEDVFGYGKLVEVKRDEITIKAKNGDYVILTTRFGGATRVIRANASPIIQTENHYKEEGFERIGNKVSIDPRYRDRAIREDLPRILMEAASEPVLENGNIVGFRIFEFEQNSMFAKLGLKPGDIVKEINKVPLNNVSRSIQLLNSLKQEPYIEVLIDRNGETVKLEISIR